MKATIANFATFQRQYDNRQEPEDVCEGCEFVQECFEEGVPVNCPLNEGEER
jgi:hypothetical protein